MGSRRQADRRKRQADVSRRRRERLRDPEGWRPPPPPEAAWLGLEPLAAAGEPVADIALFDAAALAALPPDMRAEAELVIGALDLAAAGRSDAAVDRLAPIGRKTAYADWRLFLRGLAPFQAGDLAGAREAWSRLAPDRRPGRIAAVLTGAWEEVRAPAKQPRQPAPGGRPPAAAAAMLGRSSLWAAAREIASIRHRDQQRTFSASQAALVIRLEKQYRSIDPDFVRDFSAACRLIAFGQDDAEPFVALCRGTAGPPDDPRNTRLQFTSLRIDDAEPSELRACIRDYIDRDLAGIEHLPAALRAALASMGLCRTAESIGQADTEGPFGGRSRDDGLMRERLLREAIERFPRNHRAHEALVKLLEDRAAESEGGGAAERAFIAAKTALVEQFPDRHEHLVDLVDRLMDSGEFEKAEPLVRLLSDRRCTDPAARAAPWRFGLRRASRLATKADGLPQARTALATAIAAWPPWMSRRWIAFLEATLLLREGDEGGHAAALAAARQATPHGLHADMLEYEALAQLAGPKPRVKTVATTLRSVAKGAGIDADVGPLVAVGCFYLDLERSGLYLLGPDHPARALGRAFVNRVGQQGARTAGQGGRATGTVGGTPAALPVDEPAFWAAFRWLANHAFFDGVNPKREPRGFTQLADTHPRAAAEVLFWLASAAPDTLTSRRSRKRLSLVEAFLPGVADPVVRTWLTTIVARVRNALDHAEHRKRQARRRSRAGFPFGPGSALPPGFGSSAAMPPLFRLVLERGGPGALAEMIPLIMGPKSQAAAERIAKICMRHGISSGELVAALAETEAHFSEDD
jgi:hypothetical protein